MKQKLFGTDGIRGPVGQFPITPEFMVKLGRAIGQVFLEQRIDQKSSDIFIGKDTRLSGYMLESALEAGILSSGANVTLLGPMPTPAVAYLVRAFRASAGVVISASHNSYQDNGIKLFSSNGLKLSEAVEKTIEDALLEEILMDQSIQIGKARRIEDSPGRYIEFCKASVPRGLRLSGLRIVLDCANGSTYHIACRVFEELGAEVILIGVNPDGVNINQNCGSTNPKLLQEKVLETQANVGIAFDGDGDRVLLVDEKGHCLDGDDILFLIVQYWKQSHKMTGGVVGTLMTNSGLEHALKLEKIPFIRTKVGDRYVLEQMYSIGWSFGGEPSGHVVCLDFNTTGDGIIAALQALLPLLDTGVPLSELRKRLEKYSQQMVNLPFDRMPSESQVLVDELAKIQKRYEKEMGDKGRLLIRQSGTEPLLRLMVEHQDEEKGKHILDLVTEQVVEVCKDLK